jgi:hypothetical protein
MNRGEGKTKQRDQPEGKSNMFPVFACQLLSRTLRLPGYVGALR